MYDRRRGYFYTHTTTHRNGDEDHLARRGYERLRAHKRAGESFSDVVKRLAGERSWTEVAGILSEDEASDLETLVGAGRARSRERRTRLGENLRSDE